MPLQIDATVQYVVGKTGNWWPNNLTREQLAVKSPYNTYLNTDLPPQPIANPGLASLEAALNPAETDYLYYLSDSGGFNHYATNLEGHNQNIAEFLDWYEDLDETVLVVFSNIGCFWRVVLVFN